MSCARHLNAIIGIAECCRKHWRGGLRTARPRPRSGHHLLALINDILDFSKIEAGRRGAAARSFALASLIGGIVKTIEPLLAVKNANHVVVIMTPRWESMVADAAAAGAVLNLSRDANKFTRHRTYAVDADNDRRTASRVTIGVTDTGIGMTSQQNRQVARNTPRRTPRRPREYSGAGLGLPPISRRFCQMMGGDITVESEPGRGSTFTIRLPRIVELPKEVEAASPGFFQALISLSRLRSCSIVECIT